MHVVVWNFLSVQQNVSNANNTKLNLYNIYDQDSDHQCYLMNNQQRRKPAN